jgi:hypothetical protein
MRIVLRAAAALLLSLALDNSAIAGPDPAANRRASASYEAVVRANPQFRDDRAYTECDPIQSLDLRVQCLASFDQASPTIGTLPPRATDTDLMHPVVTETNGPVRNPDD